MLSFRASLAFLLVAAVFATPAIAADSHTTSTSHNSTHKKTTTHKSKKKAKKTHGQQAIDSARVLEIQQALIREHYLSGETTGQWDASTTSAMQKFQADQGWQTKLMPDSRALKKLGLGPDYSGAINASNSSLAIRSQQEHSLGAGRRISAASGVNR